MTDIEAAPMAVKFAEGSDTIIEGLGIPFGGPFAGKDIQGETFTPDTDFCLDWFEKRPLLYNHGLDGKIGTSRVGDVIAHEMTDDGVWVKAQLDKRTKYYQIVKQLIDAQGAGFSSGAVAYLSQRSKSGEIKRWPWFEMSLTSTPANPKATVYAVKAADALEHLEAAHIDIPEPLAAALKAVDEWATEQTPEEPEPEPYAEQTTRVLAEFKAWVDASVNRVEMRLHPEAGGRKAGRVLSAANLSTIDEAIRLLTEVRKAATGNDEAEAEASKAVAEYLRLEAAMFGAIPE